MGALPPLGQWVRLEVRASQLNLEGAKLNGMSFMLVDGRATWDYCGRMAAPSSPPANAPPTISPIADQTTEMNQPAGPIHFTVADNETPADQWIVWGTSSNQQLVPNSNIAFSGGGSSRSLSIVQFKLDGNNLGTEDTSEPYRIIWDTTSTAEGSRTLTAVARGAAGNQTVSNPVTVFVVNLARTPHLFVSDSGSGNIYEFAPDGTRTTENRSSYPPRDSLSDPQYLHTSAHRLLPSAFFLSRDGFDEHGSFSVFRGHHLMRGFYVASSGQIPRIVEWETALGPSGRLALKLQIQVWTYVAGIHLNKGSSPAQPVERVRCADANGRALDVLFGRDCGLRVEIGKIRRRQAGGALHGHIGD
ncbi:MAG: Ig-like domain-containing protein [Verrucomicrobia bacterium]|nr:Ig-like domain-containing protein [Verrucomicrobiota bacterium]